MHSALFSSVQGPAQTAPLERLARVLEDVGMPEFLAAFPDGQPSISDWAAATASLADDVRPVHEFLLLGRAVDTRILPPELQECFPQLSEVGILDHQGGKAQLIDAVLMRPLGLWLFAAPPSPFETDLYFGADSVQLARQLDIVPGSFVLDLCSGTGLQGLAAASRGATVHTVEINAAAAAVAGVNVALNGFADRMSRWTGDLFAPLPAEAVYDQVIANIPFLPGVANEPDGFAAGRAILRRLPSRLAPDGTACLTALVLTTPEGHVLPGGLREFCDRAGRGLVARLGESWPVEAESSLVQTLADEVAEDEDDFADRVDEIVRGFRRRGVVEARTAVLHIGPVGGAGAISFVDSVTEGRA